MDCVVLRVAPKNHTTRPFSISSAGRWIAWFFCCTQPKHWDGYTLRNIFKIMGIKCLNEISVQLIQYAAACISFLMQRCHKNY